MTLNIASSPWLSRFSPPINNNNVNLLSLLLHSNSLSSLKTNKLFKPRASLKDTQSNGAVEGEETSVLDEELSESSEQRNAGFVSGSDCRLIINAALDRNNADLALSVFYAMRSSFDKGVSENGPLVNIWKWSKPDVGIYTYISSGLGGIVKGSFWESCKISHLYHSCCCCSTTTLNSGTPPAKCSMEIPAWKRGLKSMRILKQTFPAAVHSILVQTPSGMACTHRFATEKVDLPAQEGERATIACAAPSNVYREVGPFKFSPNAPNFYPGEPICLTNHKDGRESQSPRAPAKDGNSSLLKPEFFIQLLTVLAAGEVASGILDPSLPHLLSVAAVGSLAVGATLNAVIFPQLNQLPRRSMETTAIKQQLYLSTISCSPISGT
ncbi:hypothetical protein CRYUN_Cryun12cG0059200 [Craigia yunnanensis]